MQTDARAAFLTTSGEEAAACDDMEPQLRRLEIERPTETRPSRHPLPLFFFFFHTKKKSGGGVRALNAVAAARTREAETTR